MVAEDQKEYVKEIDRLKNRLSKKNREIKDLKIKNLFLESLFDGISEEIMVIDRDFIIKDANKAFLNRCNLKKSDVLDKKCYELNQRSWAPCIANNRLCPVERAVKTGEAVEITHSYNDKDGNLKEFIIIIYPLMPEGEEIKYFLEIIRDVTEYRHLILKLQRSEKRFKAILDTATDAIISVDENHKIILFNNAAQMIFRYSSAEVIGKDLNMLIPSGYGNHHKHIERFLDKRESDIIGKTIFLNSLRKDGETIPIELSLSFLDMGGKVTFTAIIRDITEQQMLEAKMLQAERLAAVGQAVAHVAHEIRNPLMIIGGFSNQIKSSLVNEKDINKIDMVLDEVLRLERLVANLGDFTKEYKLVKRPADINSVIKDVLKIMAGLFSADKYKFIDLLSNEVTELNCDPDKLKQVFINVISNGLEAMPDGGIISISNEKIPNGVEIKINDEGIGISDENIKNIFEPFYTTRESGSGLGLAISYKLIEAHDGDIWAVSNEGKGTTFIIQIPDS
ncbi:PAS domain S-box protein [Deltaproteobacteria bacterium]|nr:PAS domain S-box protein [Deltaproteobacteria bacterium]